MVASRRSTDISLLQYKEGLANYARVLESTRSLAVQRDQYIQAKGDIILNVINLYKALGGGWQLGSGKPFVPLHIQEKMKERTKWGELLEISHGEQLPGIHGGGRVQKPDW